MVIVETPIFTKRVLLALTDDEYRALQAALIASPSAGPVIPGGGGFRKLRWVGSGRGKRGGTRVIYRWFPERKASHVIRVPQAGAGRLERAPIEAASVCCRK